MSDNPKRQMPKTEQAEDGRLFAPPAARNRDPILAVLEKTLPNGGEGSVIEIAGGTGEHAVHFAAAFPHLYWQPSELAEDGLASIAAWIRHLRATEPERAVPADPIPLDVTRRPWALPSGLPAPVAVVNCNMIHIAPWAAAEGLIGGAGEILSPGGVLFLYGPFKRGGEHTAPSNASFDDSLRARDPSWGIRNVEDVEALARAGGFELEKIVEMPANNLSVIFRMA